MSSGRVNTTLCAESRFEPTSDGFRSRAARVCTRFQGSLLPRRMDAPIRGANIFGARAACLITTLSEKETEPVTKPEGPPPPDSRCTAGIFPESSLSATPSSDPRNQGNRLPAPPAAAGSAQAQAPEAAELGLRPGASVQRRGWAEAAPVSPRISTPSFPSPARTPFSCT